MKIQKTQEELNAELHNAIGKNDAENVIRLIGLKADVNAMSIIGLRPLDYAAQVKDVTITEHLIKGGANVNACNKAGKTPLHFATNTQNIEALIELGAKVDAQDNLGKTLLHYIMQRALPAESINALKRLGANVNAQDKFGNTPLHYVAIDIDNEEERIENARALLLSGANVNARNANGETPLLGIKEKLHIIVNPEPMVKLLLEHKADTSVMNSGSYLTVNRMKKIIENINEEQKRFNDIKFNDIKEDIEKSSEINAEELVTNINKANFDVNKKDLLIKEVLKSEGLKSYLDFAKIVNGIFEQDVDKTRCLLLTLKELSPEQTILMCKEDRSRGFSEIRDSMNNLKLESDDAKETIFRQFIKNMRGSITQENVETMITGIGIKDLDHFKIKLINFNIRLINSAEIEASTKRIITEAIDNLSKTASVGTTKRPNTPPVVEEPSEDEKKASINKVEEWLKKITIAEQAQPQNQYASEEAVSQKSKEENTSSNTPPKPHLSPRSAPYKVASSAGARSDGSKSGGGGRD